MLSLDSCFSLAHVACARDRYQIDDTVVYIYMQTLTYATTDGNTERYTYTHCV